MIESESTIMMGKPVVAGTRITAEFIVVGDKPSDDFQNMECFSTM